MYRTDIIKLLRKQDLSVEQLAEKLDVGKIKLSKQLDKMVKKNTIKIRNGKYYWPIEILEKKKEETKPKKLGLSEQIDELNDKLDMLTSIRKKQEKSYSFKGINIKKLQRYNRGKSRACLMLRNNSGAELVKGTFMQGMVKIGENYHDGSAMFTWMFRDKMKLTPLYIIPEWSTRPLSSKEVYNKAVDDDTLIDSQVITLRAMKMEQTEKMAGKKIGGMGWVGIVIGIIIVIWLIFGGKK